MTTKEEQNTRLFTYTNYCNSSDATAFKKNYSRLLQAAQEFPVVQVEANDILLADEAYELLTLIAPHTPPILVTIQ